MENAGKTAPRTKKTKDRRGHSFTLMVGSGGAKGRRGPSSGLGGGSDETTGLESSRSWVGLKSVEDEHQS